MPSTKIHLRAVRVREDGALIEWMIKEGNRLIGKQPVRHVPRMDIDAGAMVAGVFPFSIDPRESTILDKLDANTLAMGINAVEKEPHPRARLRMEVRNSLGSRGWLLEAWLPGGAWVVRDCPVKLYKPPPEYKDGSVTLFIPTAYIGAKGRAPTAIG